MFTFKLESPKSKPKKITTQKLEEYQVKPMLVNVVQMLVNFKSVKNV